MALLLSTFAGLAPALATNRAPLTRQYELEQYEHYLDLIQPRIPTNSSSEAKLFEIWSHHEVFTRTMWLEKFTDSAMIWNDRVRRWHQPLWHRIIVKGHLLLDCSYTVQLENMTAVDFGELDIIYRVRQADCVSRTDVQGGASIDGLVTFGVYTAQDKPEKLALTYVGNTRCVEEDLYNNEYLMHCYIAVPEEAAISNGADGSLSYAICSNSTFMVQFEHFDAFSELKDRSDTLDHYIPRSSQFVNSSTVTYLTSIGVEYIWSHLDSAENQVMCLFPRLSPNANVSRIPKTSLLPKSTSTVSSTNFWSELDVPVQVSFVPTNVSLVPPEVYVFKDFSKFRLDRISISSSSRVQYDVSAFIPLQQIDFCTKFTQINFIGESHMRYNWDFNMKYYFQRSMDIEKMTPHHQTTYDNKLWTFEWQIFIENAATELINSADSVQSLKSPQHVARIVVQTGSWDLQHWPLRNIMENPNFGVDTFRRALTEIYDRRLLKATSGVVLTVAHIIIVDTAPLLRQVGNQFSDGWRNNYAIPALNQRLVNVVLSFIRNHTAETEPRPAFDHRDLQFSHWISSVKLKITFLNFAQMFFSKGWANGAVCYNHALCRNENGLHSIPQGLVVLNTINHLVCGSDSMKDALLVTSKDYRDRSRKAEVYKLLQQLNKVAENWRIWSYHEYDIVRTDDDPSESYLISKGLKRRVPDKRTYDWLSEEICAADRTTILYLSTGLENESTNRYCVTHHKVVRTLPRSVINDIATGPEMSSIFDGGIYHCPIDQEVFLLSKNRSTREVIHCFHNGTHSNHHHLPKFCPRHELLLTMQEGDVVEDCRLVDSTNGLFMSMFDQA
jgi:NADH:ubiquinone oxidoreductase subunit